MAWWFGGRSQAKRRFRYCPALTACAPNMDGACFQVVSRSGAPPAPTQKKKKISSVFFFYLDEGILRIYHPVKFNGNF